MIMPFASIKPLMHASPKGGCLRQVYRYIYDPLNAGDNRQQQRVQQFQQQYVTVKYRQTSIMHGYYPFNFEINIALYIANSI